MRRGLAFLSMAFALALAPSALPTAATAAPTLRPCLAGHHVSVAKGKATMLVQGRRVACAVAKPAKPTPTPTPTPTASSSNPPMGVLVRFSGDAMNSLTVHAGLTVTLRNADATPHTLVIASQGISVLVPANDISAFLAPTAPGTYSMTTSENPAIQATLVVVP